MRQCADGAELTAGEIGERARAEAVGCFATTSVGCAGRHMTSLRRPGVTSADGPWWHRCWDKGCATKGDQPADADADAEHRYRLRTRAELRARQIVAARDGLPLAETLSDRTL
jgi:hypothetical protein